MTQEDVANEILNNLPLSICFSNTVLIPQTFAQLAIFDAELPEVVAVPRASQILPGNSKASCMGDQIPNDLHDINNFGPCDAEDLMGNFYSLDLRARLS